MEPNKIIHLKQRDQKTGRFNKGRHFKFFQMMEIIMKRNVSHFNHWLWGRIRLKTLETVMYTMADLIDEDLKGKEKAIQIDA
jgi:hypothetical protein